MSTPAVEQVYPLTLVDELFAGLGLAMVWIVEGRIDIARITAALDRIIARWPMLAGRIERGNDQRLRLRVPLPQDGKYPPGYKLYAASSTTNPRPLTDFVPLPLPVAHDVPPMSLMLSPDTPQTAQQWIDKSLPLTYWHVTHFAQEKDGAEYSAIGVAFPHTAFDGLGITYVIHALEAELLGRAWEPPSPPVDPHAGNALESVLTNVMVEQDKGLRAPAKESYAAFINNMVWHKTQYKTVIIPEKAYTRLRDRIRDEASKDQAPISTADVMAALIFKTVFADAPHSSFLQLCSIASGRRFASPALAHDISAYPHNFIVALPSPLFNGATLSALPLPALAAQLAAPRHTFSLEDVADFYKVLQTAWALPGRGRNVSPFNPRAKEHMFLSNMTIARIVDVDWTGAGVSRGVGKTVCWYKDALTGMPLRTTNSVTVAGKLPDGALVLDLALSKKRMDMFEARVMELIMEAEEL